MRFFKFFLLALAALTFVSEAKAQRRIEDDLRIFACAKHRNDSSELAK